MSYGGPPQGQAAGYYQQSPYGGPYQPPPPPPPRDEQQYAPPPGPPPQPSGPPPQYEKESFDQVFRIQKPKWNDLWAGILVRERHPAVPGRPPSSLCPIPHLSPRER